MDSGTVTRIEDWSSRPLSGGYAGLGRLADEEFTGAVTVNGAWLFMLNGKILGVFDGVLDAFEAADGTAYEAPHPSLPLLYAMQETGGEVQAEYYTDDTPLREVDSTLSEGSFTGFIELSENVLSGDYYVVYYGGRSLSTAFLGNAERLVSGDEAFERANDEVGIYSVNAVDLDVRSVPEPTTSPADGAGVGTATEPEPESGAPDVGSDQEGEGDEPTVDPLETASLGSSEDEGENVESEADASPESGETIAIAEAEPIEPDGIEDDAGEQDRSGGVDDTPDTGFEPDVPPTPGSDTSEETADEGRDDEGASSTPEEPTAPGTDTESREVQGEGERPGDEDPFSEEEAWRETRTVPALDPDQSQQAVPARERAARETAEPTSSPPADPEGTEVGGEDAVPDRGTPVPRQVEERVTELETMLESREETIDELRSRLDEVVQERDSVEGQADRLRDRLDRTGVDAGTEGTGLDPETALAQTDLFVRYGSKGKATLEDAHDGEAQRDEVTANLRMETHTRFDADHTTIDGQPYDAFLQARTEYRFVDWIVEELLFEISETGKQRALRDLFDVIPRIDRIELRGEVEVETEDGGDRAIDFDLVFRDRMGHPLLIANVNDSRDPATDDMMEHLIEGASSVAETHESLGGAFLVTSSFFRPDALEVAANETGGGFLNRDSRSSFVKLGRKQGYHLCLVEARDEDFHVAVPEL